MFLHSLVASSVYWMDLSLSTSLPGICGKADVANTHQEDHLPGIKVDVKYVYVFSNFYLTYFF